MAITITAASGFTGRFRETDVVFVDGVAYLPDEATPGDVPALAYFRRTSGYTVATAQPAAPQTYVDAKAAILAETTQHLGPVELHYAPKR